MTSPARNEIATVLDLVANHFADERFRTGSNAGRTLEKPADDGLVFFERPGTSDVPTEAINGCLEHLRDSALGFCNLTNYLARSLLESGGFRPRLHPAR